MSEVTELIDELIRSSPEEVFGPEPEPTEEEMEKMAAWYFERDREYDAEKYGRAAGRFYYNGPAVFTDEKVRGKRRDDVVRATKVDLQYDNLAFDWVVYPREG